MMVCSSEEYKFGIKVESMVSAAIASAGCGREELLLIVGRREFSLICILKSCYIKFMTEKAHAGKFLGCEIVEDANSESRLTILKVEDMQC